MGGLSQNTATKPRPQHIAPILEILPGHTAIGLVPPHLSSQEPTQTQSHLYVGSDPTRSCQATPLHGHAPPYHRRHCRGHAPAWPRPHDASQAPPTVACGLLLVPTILGTCSRAGARRRYFPRELGAVPSVEAPSGQAEQEIRRTRGNSRESEREARTVWRRGSDALGPRPARREQSEAERGRGQVGGASSALGAASPSDTFGVLPSPTAVLEPRRR